MKSKLGLLVLSIWAVTGQAQPLAKRFHKAVFEGNLQETKRLVLEEGADIRGSETEFVPPGLIVAAAYGHYKIAAFLLSQGANPNEEHYPSKLLPRKVSTMDFPLNRAINALIQVLSGSDLRVTVDPAFPSKKAELRATIDLLVQAGAKLEGEDSSGVASELLYLALTKEKYLRGSR